MKLRRTVLSIITVLSLAAPCLQGGPLPRKAPHEVGFSEERLDRLHEAIGSYVESGKHSGITTLIARDGHIIDWKSFGKRDIEEDAPMRRNTIFRIYSMTKTITTTAVLMLFEEGKIALTHPVTEYLPDLADPKVLGGGTAESPKLEPAERAVTIHDLLTHTSGYTYAFLGNDPIHQIYEKANLWEAESLDAFIDHVAKLPLSHQPGSAWSYGISLDILGAVVAKTSGRPFDEFLEERIFEPLRMDDTAFYVPESKRSRLATIYEHGPNGELQEADAILGAKVAKGEGFPSGGGGLFSTVGDYLRFAQMLLNGGTLEGDRILSPKTVQLMLTNHLSHLDDRTITWSDAEGFGLGGAVRIKLARGQNLGSVGQYGWYGAATTYYNIDPKENTVALLFTQHVPFDEHNVFYRFNTMLYQTMIESHSE